MASTDARPVPIKNTAYRVTFPIYDADGDLVTGATGLDSERSLDGATFADCTNEATEIATSSGMYFLDLTAAEMNTDCTAVIVKTTTVGAKTTAIVLYPNESGDIDVDVTAWLGTAAATPTVAGVPEVDVTHWIGTAAATPTVAGVPEVDVTHWIGTAAATPTVAGVPEVDVTHLGGGAQSATDLKDFADAGYDPATNKVEGVKLADSLTAVAADGITASSIAADAIGTAELSAAACNKIADHILRRSLATARAGSDGDAVAFRSIMGAVSKLVNKWAISGTTLTIYEEDDSTAFETQTVTPAAGADPISAIDTD